MERGGVETVDETAGLVHDRRFEQDLGHAAGLDELEWCELDRVGDDAAGRVVCFDANPRKLERIRIRPVNCVRRTLTVVADQSVVHVEPNRTDGDVRRMSDLRYDPDR